MKKCIARAGKLTQAHHEKTVYRTGISELGMNTLDCGNSLWRCLVYEVYGDVPFILAGIFISNLKMVIDWNANEWMNT